MCSRARGGNLCARLVQLWLPALPFLRTPIHDSGLNGINIKGVTRDGQYQLWLTEDGQFCEVNLDETKKPAFLSVALVVARYSAISVIDSVEAKLLQASKAANRTTGQRPNRASARH